MTRTTPLRRTMRHLSHIFRTDARTFMTFSYGGRGGHSWTPFRSRGELIRAMASHIEKNRPVR